MPPRIGSSGESTVLQKMSDRSHDTGSEEHREMIHGQNREVREPFHLAAACSDEAIMLIPQQVTEQRQRRLVSHQHASFRRWRTQRLRRASRRRSEFIHDRAQHPAWPAQRLEYVDDLAALVRWHQHHGPPERKRRITLSRPGPKHDAAQRMRDEMHTRSWFDLQLRQSRLQVILHRFSNGNAARGITHAQHSKASSLNPKLQHTHAAR